jgi:Protein of unknown function (DUF1549)/Protein of unknown function (DUF1553)/Planctomycete cytochrome C
VLARRLCMALMVVVAPPTLAMAADRAPEAETAEHFERQIRPLLADHCWKCHGKEKQEASLRLDSAAALAAGGDSGPVVVQGNPLESLLVRAIGYQDELKMPPDGKLNDGQIALLTTWVKNGATWPKYDSDQSPPDAARLVQPVAGQPDPLWALRPMGTAPPPRISSGRKPASGVDRFILAKIAEKSLSLAPPADKRTLARRAYFDLLGLPPKSEEVEAFVADSAPDAFARLVDRLLALPQYGERWARHWLDVARYADSGGYETDIYFRNAWRYRDYVVKSFNDDKPYDRFVQEQIAADEMWPDDLSLAGSYVMPQEKLAHLEARIGTGLYALGPQIHESNMDAAKLDYERLTDWVDTTGSVFLGLTLGCARCHDHKFDPFSQRDYYAFHAIFSGSREIDVPLVNGMEIADFKQFYPRVIAVDEARRAYRLFEERIAGRPPTEAEKNERQALRDKIATAVLDLPVAAGSSPGDKFDGLMEIPTATVLGHLDGPLVRPVHILQRGDLDRPKAAIGPDIPRILREATGYQEPFAGPHGSRKQLALWLTRPEHPLAARVMVNRIWQWHFGTGLVPTPNDFGKMGLPPSHPELLDWLARELVAHGWSIKQLHRTIMLSEVYQRASAYHDADNLAKDADNRYMWRMNRRRLQAEALWDYVHATAGTINLKIGGRPIVPRLAADEMSALREPWQWTVTADPKEHTRRGLYVIVRRNFRFPMFEVFDSPVNSVSSPRRDETTVTPQALWSLNNHRAFGQAQAMADRLVREVGTDLAACAARAWIVALQRPASETELSSAINLVETLASEDSEPLESPGPDLARLQPQQAAALTKLCLAIFNLNEFLFVD